jgi:hypothetical protein
MSWWGGACFLTPPGATDIRHVPVGEWEFPEVGNAAPLKSLGNVAKGRVANSL